MRTTFVYRFGKAIKAYSVDGDLFTSKREAKRIARLREKEMLRELREKAARAGMMEDIDSRDFGFLV